eukprot:TRINITY_DN3327_c0_g1_i1.p1 TRINITY_DN3327_c0_g1~~TRINITY_DN3327_c0_g1_i1.p1  ORF type:complete len:390 (-),score=65.53 TRINITY_DN3327_c0_g1_i1:18-1187(-)
MRLFLILVLAYVLSTNAQPEIITLEASQNNLRPEGIEYDPRLGFILGSVALTQLFAVADTGVTTPWGPDFGHNSVGLEIDYNNQIVYAATTNTTLFLGQIPTFQAGVVAISFAGQILYNVDLTHVFQYNSTTGLHLANDLVFDSNGNVYVTDSLGWQVWRVLRNGTAEVFYSNQTVLAGDFSPGLNGLGPNGILIDEEKNILLVAVVDTVTGGKLVKIDLTTKNAKFVTIANNVAGFDGLLWDPANSSKNAMYAVSGNGFVMYMVTSDDWDNAVINAYFPPPASVSGSVTTLCNVSGQVYGIFDHIFGSTNDTPSIVRISPLVPWPLPPTEAPTTRPPANPTLVPTARPTTLAPTLIPTVPGIATRLSSFTCLIYFGLSVVLFFMLPFS